MLYASPTIRPFSIDAKYHHGFLINHSPKGGVAAGMSLGPVNGAELQIEWNQTGERPWHHTYRMPKWGLSVLYLDMGKRMYGGNLINLIAYQSVRMFRIAHLDAHFRMGTGLGYATDVYDAKTNPRNMWLSAVVSPIMHGMLELHYRLSGQLGISASGAFTHLSNGNLRRPNLGVNIPTLSLGVRYQMANTYYEPRVSTDEPLYPTHRNMVHVQLSGGTKTLPEFGTAYYPVYAASIQYGRRLSGVSKLFVALDYFNDRSLAHREGYAGQDVQRIGMQLAHEWVLGRLSLFFGPGFYLYKKTAVDPNNYLKVGLRHHWSRHVYGSMALKAHYGQADCFEWSLGYTF